MSMIKHHPLEKALDRALDGASKVPTMHLARIEASALAAFPYRKPFWKSWTMRVSALAATIILGFGGFMAVQSYQADQRALTADADAFAEALLSESF